MAGKQGDMDAKEIAEYMSRIQESADKFSDFVQCYARMFDMEVDEMCLVVGNLTESTILNLLRDGNSESVAMTLGYIDTMSHVLNLQKDAIIKEHMESREV